MRLLHYLALLALLALPLSIPARALDPARSIAQYQHSRWMLEHRRAGADLPDRPGQRRLSLACGGRRALPVRCRPLREDRGRRKHRIPWIGHGRARHPQWRHLDLVRPVGAVRGLSRRCAATSFPHHPPTGRSLAWSRRPDGAIWAGIGDLGRPLLRRHQGRWESIGADWGLPRDQLLWDAGRRRTAPCGSPVHQLGPSPRTGRPRRFQQVLATPHASGTLTADKVGRIWLSDKAGTRAITGPGAWGRRR